MMLPPLLLRRLSLLLSLLLLLLLDEAVTQRPGSDAATEGSYYDATAPVATPSGGWRVSATAKADARAPPRLGLPGIAPQPDLEMELSWYSDSIVRVQIQDRAAARWRPERVLPDLVQLQRLAHRPAHTALSVSAATGGALGFTVKRAGFDAELFRLRELFFSDQVISFSTPLPADPTLFGLGEAKSRLKTPLGRRAIFNADSGTRGGVPLYGSHPFYVDWRQAGGTLQSASTEIGDAGHAVLSGASTAAHGVLLLNSNAMEVTLSEKEEEDPDAAAAATAELEYELTGGSIDLFFFAGPSPAEVIQQYHSIIGRPVMPPLWSLGFHQCRWGYQNLQEVIDVADGFEQQQLPLETVWVDIDYMDAYKIFTTDPVSFPVPAFRDFIDRLHQNGQRIVLIVDPGVKIEPGYSTYEELLAQGLYLRDPPAGPAAAAGGGAGGAPTVGKVWAGPSLFPDWNHPNATRYWSAQVASFLATLPIDGLWTDMNEVANFCDGRCVIDVQAELDAYAQDPDSLFQCICETRVPENRFDRPPLSPYPFANDSLPIDQQAGTCRSNSGNNLDCGTLSLATRHFPYDDEMYNEWNMHSLFAHMEAKATHAALAAARDQKRPFILTRSSFVGTGRFAAKWLGDNSAEFEDMALSIPGLLTASMFGFSMIGADICGFNAPADTSAAFMEELCTRWMQLGAWYPFSRNHNAWKNPGHEPFRLGEVVLQASRQALITRMSLTLYFYNLFHTAATSGGTVARPLSFEFPDDTSTWDIDTQFMVGPAFMISPVLEAGAERVEVYFPGGGGGGGDGSSGTIWYDYWTGKRVVSSALRRLYVSAPLGSSMPVHVRGGQIVPRQSGGLTTAATVVGDIDLLVVLPWNDCDHPTSSTSDQPIGVGSVYLDDGETALEDAQAVRIDLSVLWSPVDTCTVGSARGFSVTGQSAPAATTAPEALTIPTVSTITVFGIECAPGMVTLQQGDLQDLQTLEATWDANTKSAVIQLAGVDIQSTFEVSYECGTMGTYTMGPAINTQSGIQAELTFVQSPHIAYGDFLPISPLSLTVTQMADDTTVRVRIADPSRARWEVPDIVQQGVPATTPTSDLSTADIDMSVAQEGDTFTLTLRRTGSSATSLPIFTMEQVFFSDQYLTFSTVVEESPSVYGLQSRKAQLKLPLGTYPIVASSWFPSPKGHPLYSANPSYVELRKPPASTTSDGSAAAHGVFLLNSNAMDAVLEPSRLTFKITGGIIDVFVFSGPTPSQFVQQYQSVIGRPMMPPLWATGFHQCRYGYEDVAHMEAVLDGFNEHDLPVDAIWADIDYLDDYKIWTNDEVHWPRERFAELIEKTHEQDKRVVTIVDSGIRAEPGGYSTFDRLLQQGVYVQQNAAAATTTPGGQQQQGAPYLGKVWPRVAAFTDWKHPEAQNFWTDELRRFHSSLEIDGMWLDMDEIESFCDGRCSINFEVEDQLFAENADSLYSCECPTQHDNPLRSRRCQHQPWLSQTH
eukprot:COSAG06_NODE_805_length_12169_cov_11.782022_1_plen_1483_part_00